MPVKLISEGAFSLVVASSSPYVYYIRKDSTNHHDHFYKTDLTNNTEVHIDEYATVKFGKAWRSIHSPYTECIPLNNGDYLSCHFESSVIYRHSPEGEKVYSYNIDPLQSGFDTIYSITLDRDRQLWLSQPSEHAIAQYDLNTEKLLFKIGGAYDTPEPLNYPEQVRAYGDSVYISELGNNRVSRLHIETKQLENYLQFDEPVLEYAQYKEAQLVVLKSGLYQVL